MSSLYSTLKVYVENGRETDYDWILFHYPAFIPKYDTFYFRSYHLSLTHHYLSTADELQMMKIAYYILFSVLWSRENEPDPSPRIRTTDLRIRILLFLSVTSGCQQIIFIKKSQKTVVIKDFLNMFA